MLFQEYWNWITWNNSRSFNDFSNTKMLQSCSIVLPTNENTQIITTKINKRNNLEEKSLLFAFYLYYMKSSGIGSFLDYVLCANILLERQVQQTPLRNCIRLGGGRTQELLLRMLLLSATFPTIKQCMLF